MFELVWIVLILAVAYVLFVWVPSYWQKRKQRSKREILDLTFKEGPTVRPEGTADRPQAVRRVWISRGMFLMLILLVIAALVFRSVDLFYVILVWIGPMLLVNYLPKILHWIDTFRK